MRFLLFLSMAFLVFGGSSVVRAAVPEKPRFNRDIRPILSNNCFFCHGPDEKKREAKLRLDERASATAEHDGVRAIVPGKPDESELIARMLSQDRDEVMPPPKSKKVPATAEQIATLRKWIEQGAEYEGHWAFLPLSDAPPPAVKDRAWPKNPIDQFILARIDSEGIRPSAEADRATLIRRVYLDLIGLLPTPEEVAAFVGDPAPDAYEKIVGKLLANSHYGERWGRHWLDQARYADSNGYTIDSARAMWPYRDWVIKAINDDLPFDRFTIEQLAGDLLPKPTKSQLVATAFHRNTLINEEGGVDKEQFRNEAAVDRVNTTGAVWLGLTVGCAQCHSHKFDPITHREFYELFAFFNQGSDVNNKGETISVVRGEIFGKPVPIPVPPKQDEAAIANRQAEWEKTELAKLKKNSPLFDALTIPANERDEAQVKLVRDAFERADAKSPAKKKAEPNPDLAELMVMKETDKPRPTFIHLRGDFLRNDEKTGPLNPGGLSAVPPALPAAPTRTRLDLARWLVSADNPLTPRVTMNRVWMRYFGRGLVETEEDFGTQGTSPTHPELLDWLARTFVARGWSMKAMHRLIVTSATYRQASKLRPELAEKDPRNLLLARQERVRVEAEIIRDAALSASGLFDPTIGGPSVHPPQAEGVYAFTQNTKKWVADSGGNRFRRAMYTTFYRAAPYPLFTTFDAPDFQTVCTRRARSDTPLQALTVANDPAFVEIAKGLAARVLRDVPQVDAEARIKRAFAFGLCREPSHKELAILLAYHQQQLADIGGNDAAAAMFCVARTILNTDSFITRE